MDCKIDDFINHGSDTSENDMTCQYSSDVYAESKRMFETYCGWYNLKAECNHEKIKDVIEEIKELHPDEKEEEFFELLDDCIRGVLKPLRKRYSRAQNVDNGDVTQWIIDELWQFHSALT